MGSKGSCVSTTDRNYCIKGPGLGGSTIPKPIPPSDFHASPLFLNTLLLHTFHNNLSFCMSDIEHIKNISVCVSYSKQPLMKSKDLYISLHPLAAIQQGSQWAQMQITVFDSGLRSLLFDHCNLFGEALFCTI